MKRLHMPTKEKVKAFIEKLNLIKRLSEKLHSPVMYKVKAFLISAFFIFSFFLMFIMVSSCEPNNVSIGAVAKRFAIVIVILAVNVIVINRNFVDGEWRIRK